MPQYADLSCSQKWFCHLHLFYNRKDRPIRFSWIDPLLTFFGWVSSTSSRYCWSILGCGDLSLWLRLLIGWLNLIRMDSNRKAFRKEQHPKTRYLLLEYRSILWVSKEPCRWEIPAWSVPCWLLTSYRNQNLQVLLFHLKRRCYLVSDRDAWCCFYWVTWMLIEAAWKWQVLHLPSIVFSFADGSKVCLRCSTSRRSRSCWVSWGFRRSERYFRFLMRRGYWFSWWLVVTI